MSELKPCPFCSASAEIYKHYPPFGKRVRVSVRCTNCRCNSGEWGRTDKAIEAWNRRASAETCDTCKHHHDEWYENYCDGCTPAHSNWEQEG